MIVCRRMFFRRLMRINSIFAIVIITVYVLLKLRYKYLEGIALTPENVVAEKVVHEWNSLSTSYSSMPTLVLATTFSSKHNKLDVHSSTLRNWAALKLVLPVLYLDDLGMKDWREKAEDLGWKVRWIPQLADNMPILRDIMKDLLQQFPLPYVLFGYSNADILFDETLLMTLSKLSQKLPSRKWVVTGQRLDVRLNASVQDFKEVRRLALLPAATMEMSIYGQDYFIGHRMAINWSAVPPFVLGRLAWDNWLLNFIHKSQTFSPIDTTKTVLALHQSNPGSQGVSSSANNSLNLRLYRQSPAFIWKVRCLPLCTAWSSNYSILLSSRVLPCLADNYQFV